ncbi:hypothetical protein T4C_5334 [Trichinella pseudospiralis]|uniref:Uncharacterized protein n=1 Tax=Trichinella pseudospiralis TaxID=6337 RepID=A0A0V1K4B7_TRIPS|nr:hypothetical protein T4C_5334 [Trichinella pseudospiralis]
MKITTVDKSIHSKGIGGFYAKYCSLFIKYKELPICLYPFPLQLQIKGIAKKLMNDTEEMARQHQLFCFFLKKLDTALFKHCNTKIT